MAASEPVKRRGTLVLGTLSTRTLRRYAKERARRPPDTGSGLYAISAEGQFIKFGIAKNPDKRLDQLQVGSPFELKLIAHVLTPDAATAVGLEKLVHAALGRFHARGEWFFSCPRTLAAAGFMNRGLEFLESQMKAWLKSDISSMERHAGSSSSLVKVVRNQRLERQLSRS